MTARWLRPARIVQSDDTVWLVDESRPAALAIGGGRLELVVWPGGDDVLHDGPRVVADHAGGIVVQDATTVTWVGRRHESVLVDSNDYHLSAADEVHAWLVDNGTPDYEIPGMPDSPMYRDEVVARSSREDQSGRLVALRPDGHRVEIVTDVPVRGVDIDGDEIVVTFAERPVSHARNNYWTMEYPTSELRVAKAQLLSGALPGAPSKRRNAADFDPEDEFDVVGGNLRWAWLKGDPRVVLRHGVRAAGLVWWAGAERSQDAINRRVLVRGHDAATGHAVVAIDAGAGLVREVGVVEDELWIVVARQRLLAVPASRGVEVIAVSGDGAVRTICAPNSIDISVTQPALRARPADAEIEAAVQSVRSHFDDLENVWCDSDGNTRPLADGLSEPTVDVRDEWPDTKVVVSLRHQSRPGLILRRTVAVFDERGNAIEPAHPDIDLMEDLDTGYLAPADEAVDGVLET